MAHDQAEASIATQNRFFDEWMNLQTQDFSELLQSLNLNDDDSSKNDSLTRLINKNIQHFEDYISQRTILCREQVPVFYAPAWCTSLEKPLLWIGGCRPSMILRLVNALCGSEFESHLDKFLQGGQEDGEKGTLSELSSSQLTELDNLQRKTIKKEEKVTKRRASFQEDIADQPLAILAKKANRIDELDEETDNVLNEHEKCLASLLEEADQLRLDTLKEVLNILTPKQAVEFLTVGKKLHLCVHAWGKKRDEIRCNKEKQE